MASERWAWLAALVLAAGCSDSGFRRVDLAFQVPGMCGDAQVDGGAGREAGLQPGAPPHDAARRRLVVPREPAMPVNKNDFQVAK